MSDLRDLYQEVILDHSRSPRNHHRPPDANREAHGHNPLCGDRLTLWLRVAGGKILDAGFEGTGCAISTASASMMTDALKGKTEAEAQALFEEFHAMLTGSPESAASQSPAPSLGKLAAFSGVREFPIRVKCATLAWHTFNAALANADLPVSTE